MSPEASTGPTVNLTRGAACARVPVVSEIGRRDYRSRNITWNDQGLSFAREKPSREENGTVDGKKERGVRDAGVAIEHPSETTAP